MKVGQRVGRLVVLERVPNRVGRKSYWKCVCDCGERSVVYEYYLKRAITKSCGCWRRAANQKPVGVAAINRKVDYYRKNSKRRNLVFELSPEEVRRLLLSPCHYCGTQSRVTRNPSSLSGIDRVDNSEGYTLGNVVPACALCNQAKHTMEVSQFKEWVERVYSHLFNP